MIFQILTAISALICLLLTIYAFNMKHSKNTVIFAMLMLQITIFTSSNFIEIISKDNNIKLVCRNISQVCFLLAIPSLLILIIVYIGKDNILRPINVILICVFPFIGIVLKLTNRYSHLMKEDICIKSGWVVVISTPFALFIKLLELTYILLSIVLLLSFYKKINIKYRKQSIAMAAGILIPLIASILKILRPGSRLNIPIISISFTITGIILFWCIFKYQPFSIIPIARDKIIDCLQEGILTVDNNGIIIDKNSAIDRFIEDSFDKTINPLGKGLEDLLAVWPRWYSACKNMQADEFEIDNRKSGTKKYYHVKVYPIIKNSLKKMGTVSILIDITEQKNREKKLINTSELNEELLKNLTGELGRQKKQLEAVINTVSDLAYLAISDKNAKFLYYSRSSEDVFTNHIDNDESKILSHGEKGIYFYQDGRVIEDSDLPVPRVLKGEKVVNFHFIMKNNGKENHLLFNGTPIYDKNGNITHGVYFIMDITDHIRHENLISITKHLADMNALKDKLFTVFTHDIRNPMATMVSLVDLLQQDNDFYSAECREILTEVKKQVNYTYSIIENLLEWLNSQRDGLVFSPARWNLAALIEETVSLYLVSAGVKGIQISCKLDKQLVIYTDKEMLELVLRNLLSNAIKFTRKGGSITIEAFETDRDLTIAVKDTGIGMDAEKVKNLFHEGYTCSTLGTAGEKGIGLGLLICKEFILKGGGKIWAESMPGKGSTFYISLLTARK